MPAQHEGLSDAATAQRRKLETLFPEQMSLTCPVRLATPLSCKQISAPLRIARQLKLSGVD